MIMSSLMMSILLQANEKDVFDGLNMNETLNLKQTYFSGSNFELTENMNIKVFKVTRSYIGRMDSDLKRGVLAE